MFFRLSPSDYEGLHERYRQFLDSGYYQLAAERGAVITLSERDRLKEKFLNMMQALYKESGAEFRIEIMEKPEVLEFIDEHAGILDSSFATAKLSETMRKSLENSDWMFSGFKAFHEMHEAFPSLLNDKGERKTFEQFLNDVQAIDETYNQNYLNAEYNFAQSAAEMAGKWETFDHGDDHYCLQYRTQEDDKVRPEHAALNKITLPESDSFWDSYYPPNGWNCRCTVVQVRRKSNPASNHDAAMELGKVAVGDKGRMFTFNPGKEERAFPAYNPYTVSKCRGCDSSKMSLASKTSELCAACQLLCKKRTQR